MMKATMIRHLKRADGWCESVMNDIFPLSELINDELKSDTLYRISKRPHVRQFGWQRGALSSQLYWDGRALIIVRGVKL